MILDVMVPAIVDNLGVDVENPTFRLVARMATDDSQCT